MFNIWCLQFSSCDLFCCAQRPCDTDGDVVSRKSTIEWAPTTDRELLNEWRNRVQSLACGAFINWHFHQHNDTSSHLHRHHGPNHRILYVGWYALASSRLNWIVNSCLLLFLRMHSLNISIKLVSAETQLSSMNVPRHWPSLQFNCSREFMRNFFSCFVTISRERKKIEFEF